MKRLRVAVVYGGRSGEHEISLASAAAIWANLNRQKYEPIAVRIEKDGRWVLADRPPSAASAAEVIEQTRADSGRQRGGREIFLPPRPGPDTLLLLDRRPDETGTDRGAVLTSLGVDVVFPILHGPYGEDGTIQGLLEMANVAYVGCGVLASAVGMDKLAMKMVFRAHGLNVPDWVGVDRRDWTADPRGIITKIEKTLTYPVFVKPANLGSSVGISKAGDAGALKAAIATAAEFDRRIVVEHAVPEARDLECAVLGNGSPEASIAGEIVVSREFYDYEAKYIDGGTRLEIPAKLDEKVVREIQQQAVAAFRAIDGAGLARVDFLLSRKTGALFLNEINTMPGFTTISMYSKLWGATGVDYVTLIDRLIALAVERHAEKQQLKTSAFN